MTIENFCDHDCTSMCRHNGCNCECGEFHDRPDPEARAFSSEQLATIEALEKQACEEAGCDKAHYCGGL